MAQNRHGRKIKVAGSGLLARALQHELDHLAGKLYIDYLDSMDELIPVAQLARGRGRERGGAGVLADAPRGRTGAGHGRLPRAAAPSRSRPRRRSRDRTDGRPGRGRHRAAAAGRPGRHPAPDAGRRAARSSARTAGPDARRLRDPTPSRRSPTWTRAARARRLRPDRARAPCWTCRGTARSTCTRRCCRAIAARRPIPAAILAGDAETGVTLMRMDAGLDTGPIVAHAPRAARRGRDRARARGAPGRASGPSCSSATLPAWLAGRLDATPQPESGATLTRPLRRDDGRLDPASPAARLERQVRAYQPWPGSFLDDGRDASHRLAGLGARAVGATDAADASVEQGAIVADGDSVALVTADGWLRARRGPASRSQPDERPGLPPWAALTGVRTVTASAASTVDGARIGTRMTITEQPVDPRALVLRRAPQLGQRRCPAAAPRPAADARPRPTPGCLRRGSTGAARLVRGSRPARLSAHARWPTTSGPRRATSFEDIHTLPGALRARARRRTSGSTRSSRPRPARPTAA